MFCMRAMEQEISGWCFKFAGIQVGTTLGPGMVQRPDYSLPLLLKFGFSEIVADGHVGVGGIPGCERTSCNYQDWEKGKFKFTYHELFPPPATHILRIEGFMV